jgi:hypothetical protein
MALEALASMASVTGAWVGVPPAVVTVAEAPQAIGKLTLGGGFGKEWPHRIKECLVLRCDPQPSDQAACAPTAAPTSVTLASCACHGRLLRADSAEDEAKQRADGVQVARQRPVDQAGVEGALLDPLVIALDDNLGVGHRQGQRDRVLAGGIAGVPQQLDDARADEPTLARRCWSNASRRWSGKAGTCTRQAAPVASLRSRFSATTRSSSGFASSAKSARPSRTTASRLGWYT